MRIPTSTIALGLLALGCSSPPAEEVTFPTPPTGGESTVEPPTVRLLDPGAEPRALLRYRVAPGQTERLALDVGLAGVVEVEGGGEAHGSAPLARVLVNIGPTEALPDGALRYPVAIDNVVAVVGAGTPDEEIEAIDAELAPLLTLRGTVELTPEGHTRAADFQVPETANERLLTLLANVRSSLVSVPFPTQPVGVGARWEVTRRVNLGALIVLQTVTYTLGSLAGPAGGLQVTFRQSAMDQPMTHLGDGVTGRLEAYESTGVGSIDFDLTRVTQYAELDVTTQMQASIDDPDGGTSRLSVNTRAAVTVAPVP